MGENNGCMNYQVYSALFAKTLCQRATTLVIMAAHTSKLTPGFVYQFSTVRFFYCQSAIDSNYGSLLSNNIIMGDLEEEKVIVNSSSSK